RAVDVLKLRIEHRIDPVLLQQRTKAIFKAEAGKHAALIGRSLRIEIKFRCPPCFYAIFQFYGVSPESIAGARKSGDGLDGEFQIARLFHVVCVRDEVISLSMKALGSHQERCQNQQEVEGPESPARQDCFSDHEKIHFENEIEFQFQNHEIAV